MPLLPFLGLDPLLWAGAALLVGGLGLGYVLGYQHGHRQPLYVIATPRTPYPMRITVTHEFQTAVDGVVPAEAAVLDGQRGEVVS